MSHGLPEATIACIQGVLSHYPGIERAILYGSRAKGNYKPGSDIDLTLCGDRLGHEDLLAITGELDDLLLPYTIDLSILNQLNQPDLLEHIQRVGTVFYKRSTHDP